MIYTHQRIIYRLGGHCGKVLVILILIPSYALHSYWPLPRRTCLWLKRCHKNLGGSLPALTCQWVWELILDTKLGHFYHGLSSIYNLKGEHIEYMRYMRGCSSEVYKAHRGRLPSCSFRVKTCHYVWRFILPSMTCDLYSYRGTKIQHIASPCTTSIDTF